MSFLSFAFRRPGAESLGIKSAALFGSAARGDFTEGSDIDIFIDTPREQESRAQKLFSMAAAKFMESREFESWKLRNFTPKISVLAGQMGEWELKDTALRESITLYGATACGTERSAIVRLVPIRDVTKRNRVIRKLFGRAEKGFRDSGLVGKLGGERIAPAVFIVPEAGLGEVLRAMQEDSVDFRMKSIFLS
jgi:hypothetical protein